MGKDRVEKALTRRDFLKFGGTALTGSYALTLAGCGGGGQGASGKKFKIALSNSYIGNQWRIEMVNELKAALKMEPFKSQVEGSVFNSGNEVSKQSQQITNLISPHLPKGRCYSNQCRFPHGTQRHRRAGGRPRHPRHLLRQHGDDRQGPQGQHGSVQVRREACLLAGGQTRKQGQRHHGHGFAGTSVDEDRNKGAESDWKKYPGINVVNRYSGMWDSSVAQRNTSSVLPSLRTIDGIWAQGGTDGVLKAFINAGRPIPPTAGEAENGFRKFMSGYQGHKVEGLSIGQPPFLSVVALELARRILQSDYPKQDVTIPFPSVTNDTIMKGVTVFPDVQDSFFDVFTDSGPGATVEMCLKAAQSDKPCGSKLTVNLPKA
jgi:ribose transport system substrate-binding protein